MPVTWDDTIEKQLLLSIIHLTQAGLTATQWTEVAKMVGQDATAEACK